MNLFECTALVQAIRNEYDLSIPQATCVLIAYQHGTASTLSVREALNYDARTLSASHAISKPVRSKIITEVGKARVKHGSRPVSIYKLTDKVAVSEVVQAASNRSVDLCRQIDQYEITAQETINEAQ